MGMAGATVWRKVAAGCIAAAAGLILLVAVAHAYLNRTPHSAHAIYIAFGFHVNLYHSFRNDTNDQAGFGQDIRVIRHIIATLDRLNAEGIPVKGVWDFDNLFSLQELLPRHAPDIITDIRRRVRDQGDEVILMSFNNGMVSAMTPDELRDAMRWAVSNPWQSGVADLFGSYTPIVRPQEMMTTPGNFAIYRELGIQAAALYYSATPFDAFRVFSRPLTTAEAHNPLLYHNPQSGEEMVVVPTYHIGDLVEHISLRHWVSRLRRQQTSGELAHDALIFINYDADSELWDGIDLPRALRWLPNTGGIEGLIREVSDLPHVRFTTLGEYLHDRPPVGTVHFGQDTADGSFNGYSSWSEKWDATRYWTLIERHRRVSAAAGNALPLLKDAQARSAIDARIGLSRLERMRALSTTHFGMATPFLAPQRQSTADQLMDALDRHSDAISRQLATALVRQMGQPAAPRTADARLASLEWLDTIAVLSADPASSGAPHRFITVTPPGASARRHGGYYLVGPDGAMTEAIRLGDFPDDADRSQVTLYIPGPHGLGDGVYHLFGMTDRASDRSPSARGGGAMAEAARLVNQRLEVRFDPQGALEGIYLDGRRQVEPGSLMPYLEYDGQRLMASDLEVVGHTAADGRSASMRISGPLPAPRNGGICDGWLDYRFTVTDGLPYLLLDGRLLYPTTEAADWIKPDVPGLARRADLLWEAAAPAEILFTPQTTPAAPVRVLKYNFLGVAGDYLLDYFRHHPQNLNLDNVNNHITAAYVGVVAGNQGMAIAMDTSRQANFAFAPLRLRYDTANDTFRVRANPFGTYQGRQYQPPTTGNGHGFEVTLRAGEQFASAAPTYNGVAQHFGLMLAFFDGDRMPEEVQRDLLAYARPPLVISLRTPVPPSKRNATESDTVSDRRQAMAEQPPIPHLVSASEAVAHQPQMPLQLGLRVVWANVRAMLGGMRMEFGSK
ncbi:MAG: hypothetical protein KFF50_17745 [Desulfatitalea sp.]|nr:hypothetical protein [Desulfatitalea sp.]